MRGVSVHSRGKKRKNEKRKRFHLLLVVAQVNGQVVLRFAYAYGFRNIQSILAKARRGKCRYNFVEVMACPSGCVNGGGQIKPEKKEGPRDTRDRVEKVRGGSPDVIVCGHVSIFVFLDFLAYFRQKGGIIGKCFVVS